MTGSFELRVRHRVRDFGLEVDAETEARSLGVFGPSGAGKTTLLELIAGWRSPQQGCIRIGDRVLFDSERGIDVPAPARRIGYVPQEQLLFPHWTAAQNLRAGRRRLRDPGQAEALFRRAVETLELGPLLDRPVSTLSGGERQRVALARALGSDPDVLLLDEPFGGVDHGLRRRILPFLLRLREAFAVPMLFVSHDATETQALCDAVLLLERGRMTALGPSTETLFRRTDAAPYLDNVLRGRITATAASTQHVALPCGIELRVARSMLGDGASVRVAIAADQILIVNQTPPPMSARNRLHGVLTAVRALERHVLLEARLRCPCGTCALFATVSPEAAAELGLAAGSSVYLVFKSSACRLLDESREVGPGD